MIPMLSHVNKAKPVWVPSTPAGIVTFICCANQLIDPYPQRLTPVILIPGVIRFIVELRPKPATLPIVGMISLSQAGLP